MIFRSPWPDIDEYSGSICDLVLGSAAQWGSKPAMIDGETGETVTLRRFAAAGRRGGRRSRSRGAPAG